MSDHMTGTLEFKNIGTAKGGKNPGSLYAKPKIDGVRYFAPARVAELVARCTEGGQVEFTSQPPRNEDGDAVLTFIKMAGTSEEPSHTAASSGRTAQTRSSSTQGREDGDERRVSMFIAYAKDLVVAGVVKPGVSNVQGIGNAVETMAGELLRSYKRLLASERGEDLQTPPQASKPLPPQEEANKELDAASMGGQAVGTEAPPGDLVNMLDFIDRELKDQGFQKGIQMDSVKKAKANFMSEVGDEKMWAEKYVEDLIKYRGGKAAKKIVNGALEFVAK